MHMIEGGTRVFLTCKVQEPSEPTLISIMLNVNQAPVSLLALYIF